MITEAVIMVGILFIGYVFGFATGYQKGQLDKAEQIGQELQERDY